MRANGGIYLSMPHHFRVSMPTVRIDYPDYPANSPNRELRVPGAQCNFYAPLLMYDLVICYL